VIDWQQFSAKLFSSYLLRGIAPASGPFNMASVTTQYITPQQLAETLQVSTRGLARRASTLGITPIKIGHRTYRYNAGEVEVALTQNPEPTGSPTGVMRTLQLTGGRRR